MISCTNFYNISFPPFDHCKLTLFALLEADAPSLAASPCGTRSPPCTSALPLPPSRSPARVPPPPSPCPASLLPVWPRAAHTSPRSREQGTGRKHWSKKEKLPRVPPARSASLTPEPTYENQSGVSRGCLGRQEVSPRRCREASCNASTPCAGVKLSKPKFR